MKSSVIKKDIEEEITPEFRRELSSLDGKTILITGGNGFLSSYLVDTIVSNAPNSKLILINRNPITSESRLSHLVGNPNVMFVTQDVGRPFEVPGKPDIIIHAASKANTAAVKLDPINTIDANINGTRTLLEYAKNNPVEQFILFSSFEVYGNAIKEFIPTPETYTGNVDALDEMAPYNEAKRFSETLAMTFFRKYNVPVKILRILLVYGPGMRNDGKVISDFFHAAAKDKKIYIRNKGESKKSFCYVADATRAIFKLMFYGKAGEAYNIGDDTNNPSVKELAEAIAEISDNGTTVEVNMDSQRKEIYGERTRYPSISKIRALGFAPKVNLKEGLSRLKRHYEEA